MKKIKIDKKFITAFLIIIGTICLLTIWWSVRLQSYSAREEFVIEDGMSLQFEAPFAQIHGIGLSCDDISLQNYLENNKISLRLRLFDSQDNCIWDNIIEETEVSAFTITAVGPLEDVPIKLGMKEKYRIEYESDDVDLAHLTVAFYGEEKSMFGFFLIVCVFCLAVIVLGLVCMWSASKRVKILTVFGLYVILGVLYSVVLIPFSVQDENVHFAQAYAISNAMMGKETADEYGHVYIDESGLRRVSWCGDIQDEYRFWNNWEYGRIYEEKTVSGLYSHVTVMPKYVYWIPAAGITIARVFHAPYQIILMSGRLMNLIFFSALMLLAVWLCPRLKNSIMAIGLLPATLWMAASYTYDAWNLAFCILMFSYCIHCRDKEGYVNWFDTAVIMLVGILLAPIKFIYFIFAGCVLFIPWKRFKNRVYWAITIVLSVGSTIIAALVARGGSAITYATTQAVDTRSVVAEREPYSLAWILANPVRTAKVYINTLFEQGQNYIFKCISGDFAGNPLPYLLVFIIFLLALLLMANELKDEEVRWKDRLLAIGLFTMGCGLVLSTFLLVYSYIYIYSVGTIAGVQGRYFLPFVIWIPFIVQNKTIIIPEERKKYILYSLLLLSVLSIFCKYSGIIQGLGG